MRIASLNGRLSILVEGTAVDVATASDGLFSSRVADIYQHWHEFRRWASSHHIGRGVDFDPSELGPPSPAPRQIIAFGLNYREHAAEAGINEPSDLPPVFAKFLSSLSGPHTTVTLPQGNVDWEVELAVVIGREAHDIDEVDGWDYVAGVTVAQDLSERILQMSGPAPQFGLAKSHPGFLPIGPALVTIDELDNPDALDLTAEVNGEIVQHGNTRDLILPVASSLSYLSRIITLYPGDILLTGTPAGVGMGRVPPRYLADGDILTSTIEGIGTIQQTFVAK
jgi:2-keto-4-pentenoate hydratase/2-oxohepta-3-ene-1,7-dioic acid hydratase in catechol pathway